MAPTKSTPNWERIGVLLSVVTAVAYLGSRVGALEAKVDLNTQEMVYIRGRIDGIVPAPQKTPLTSSILDPIKNLLHHDTAMQTTLCRRTNP
jgi:hypothetical protein